MAILCFALILDVLVVCLFFHLQTLKHKREKERLKEQAESRLLYIRSLSDILYTYQRKPEQLCERLYEEMAVNKLLSYRVIEDRSDEQFDPALKLNKKDRLLYLLVEDGFTPRELCVLMELNNMNSVYVKYHRIRKKLVDSGVVVSEDGVPEISCRQESDARKSRRRKPVLKNSTLTEMLDAIELSQGPELAEIQQSSPIEQL